MRVILAAVHITALQFTGTRSVVAGRQLKSKQLVGTEMPSFLFIRTGPKEPRGSSNFLFFSLFLISLLFFARKASFTRILSLDLKVSLIVPFDLKVSLSLLRDYVSQSFTYRSALTSLTLSRPKGLLHSLRKLTIVRLLASSFLHKQAYSVSHTNRSALTSLTLGYSLSFVTSLAST